MLITPESFGEMFISVKGCPELMTTCWLNVKVTI